MAGIGWCMWLGWWTPHAWPPGRGFVAPCPLALRSEGLLAAEAWASSTMLWKHQLLLTTPDCSLTQKTECSAEQGKGDTSWP